MLQRRALVEGPARAPWLRGIDEKPAPSRPDPCRPEQHSRARLMSSAALTVSSFIRGSAFPGRSRLRPSPHLAPPASSRPNGVVPASRRTRHRLRRLRRARLRTSRPPTATSRPALLVSRSFASWAPSASCLRRRPALPLTTCGRGLAFVPPPPLDPRPRSATSESFSRAAPLPWPIPHQRPGRRPPLLPATGQCRPSDAVADLEVGSRLPPPDGDVRAAARGRTSEIVAASAGPRLHRGGRFSQLVASATDDGPSAVGSVGRTKKFSLVVLLQRGAPRPLTSGH